MDTAAGSRSSGGFVRVLAGLFGLALLTAYSVVIVRAVQAQGERSDVLRWLARPDAEYEVFVEGEKVPLAGSLLAGLRTLASVTAHHSHPTEPLRVEVRSRDQARTFIVAEDSDRPEEYWVFVPKKELLPASSLGFEIGRIRTTAFAGIRPGS